MPQVKYNVTLDELERQMLEAIATRGRHSSQKMLNAVILLKCDVGRFQEHKVRNQAIADVLPVSMKKIDRIKRRFVEHGLEAALDKRKAVRTYTRKTDGDFEAHLIALSCGTPPPGHARWSLRLLADRMVELQYVEAVSHETVRRVLKKRVEAVEEGPMGHSTRPERGRCGTDGARARGVHTAVRSRAARGVYGRIASATDPGNPADAAGRARRGHPL